MTTLDFTLAEIQEAENLLGGAEPIPTPDPMASTAPMAPPLSPAPATAPAAPVTAPPAAPQGAQVTAPPTAPQPPAVPNVTRASLSRVACAMCSHGKRQGAVCGFCDGFGSLDPTLALIKAADGWEQPLSTIATTPVLEIPPEVDQAVGGDALARWSAGQMNWDEEKFFLQQLIVRGVMVPVESPLGIRIIECAEAGLLAPGKFEMAAVTASLVAEATSTTPTMSTATLSTQSDVAPSLMHQLVDRLMGLTGARHQSDADHLPDGMGDPVVPDTNSVKPTPGVDPKRRSRVEQGPEDPILTGPVDDIADTVVMRAKRAERTYLDPPAAPAPPALSLRQAQALAIVQRDNPGLSHDAARMLAIEAVDRYAVPGGR